MEGVGLVYGHLVYFTVIWYILCSLDIFYKLFGIFIPVWVCCTKQNLATKRSKAFFKLRNKILFSNFAYIAEKENECF
jgi:hypothetical protein